MTTTAQPQELTQLEKELVYAVQSAFPLVERPYRALGQPLHLSEDQVIRTIRALRTRGIIRQISAIFDSRRLGYTSTLVAMTIPEERLDQGATAISAHPGVSHNYKRDHPFNLWFTLTLPPGEDIEAQVERLAQAAGATRTRLLPALRLFKIGVELDVLNGANRAEKRPPSPAPALPPGELTERDRDFVRVLQQDLPAEPRPFDGWAAELGVGLAELFAWARRMEEARVMRRFAAVLRHQEAGFVANGMICWRMSAEQAAELGPRLAAYPEVSHCYQRPIYPDWPYSVFSMVHALSHQQCEEVARRMAADIGVGDYVILYSVKEYKKTRVQYFA